MALVMSSSYTTPALGAILAAYANGWRIRLFDNNHTPADGDVIGDYTEATFLGYAALAPTWTPGVDGAGNAMLTSDPLAYSFTAGGGSATIYGYFITDPAQVPEELVGAERFGTSVVFSPTIPNLSLVVVVTLEPKF